MDSAVAMPAAGTRRRQWRVLQAEFGDGSDFLAAWSAWRGDTQRPGLLHFVAIRSQARELHEAFADHGIGLTPGFHRFAFDDGHVLLTLCVGERVAMLRELDFHADAVLLDVPDADLVTVKAVTRLCRRGSTLAGPAVGPARAHLVSCGWNVSAGEARFDPAWPLKGLVEDEEVLPGQAIVIGAGLAGAAAAASLARRGWQVDVLDAAPHSAAGASSLPVGLMAPHQTPDDNLLSRLTRAGIRITLQQARDLLAEGIEWQSSGVLESRGEDGRALPAVAGLAPWSSDASAAQKRRAGWQDTRAGWWHAQAAWVEPAALVRAWLRRPGVRFQGGVPVARVVPGEAGGWRVEDDAGRCIAEAGVVVVAAALASKELLPGLQTNPVRGQVTWAPHGDDSSALPPFPVNGDGHFLPRVPLLERGAWLSGSTYGRGDADVSVRGEDTASNLQRARMLVPAAAAAIDAAAARGELRAWAGVRCAASDRRPLVGQCAPGLWVSTAMGSRGLTFAALCGELLAARVHVEPLPVEARLAQALDAARQAGFRRA